MANNNQIELVVTVEVDKANKSIKSVNVNHQAVAIASHIDHGYILIERPVWGRRRQIRLRFQIY